MHELSIASAILDMARQKTPPEARLRSVQLRAGPLRGIEPEAMLWAWQASTDGTDCAGVTLDVELLPWRLRCPDCGAEFTHDELFAVCACGGEQAYPLGGDELQIVSLVVDDPSPETQEKEPLHESCSR